MTAAPATKLMTQPIQARGRKRRDCVDCDREHDRHHQQEGIITRPISR